MSCMEQSIFRRLIFDRGIIRSESESRIFPKLLSDAIMGIMSFGHAIWVDQCTNHLSVLHEPHIQKEVEEVLVGIL
jgi:hypothetical protein